MNRRLSLPISVLALFVSSCTPGPGSKNSGNVVQRPNPTPALSVPRTTTSTSAANNSSTSSVTAITDGNYDEVVRSQSVALVFFWAPWSAPDRLMAPVLEAVAKEYSDRVKTGKVDVDENPELARKFVIKGIPTIVVIKDGNEQERIVGVTSKESISRLLDKHLGRNP
jgi:thioredoxin 1